ncbi:MAG: Peptidoglycan glycosyltransferase [Parcubacteria group bacterium GW2011_GWA1_47_10]|nr:MAG: Peptidoglycan glycosyltransferase [Parcubacteria group bacterium GW2011_GWA1_47_10]KKU97659.1 MAG: Peptidoglycan glycosyltransferase [Parcubacteria group bacterium GW2011_GWB1_48_6]
MKSSFLLRSRVVAFLLILFSAAVVTRLFWVQVVHGDYYSGEADRQYVTPSQNVYERGTVYWQRKDGELISAAAQISGFKLTINPMKITDAAEVYKKVNAIIPMSREDFLSKASKENDPYEEVAQRLTRETVDAVSALKIPGLSVFKEKWRSYPGGDLAAHTLGFVGYKGDELGGRYGLERQYDRELSRGANEPYVNFFAEVFSNIQKSFREEDKEGDIVTTIEPKVQSLLQGKLEEVKEKYSVDLVGGIIMDPRDGSIYALAALPAFDPNKFSVAANNQIFSNPLVENVFEFGSVVKPLVMAAALDTGAVTAKTTYTDSGSVKVEKKEIFNFDKKGRGPGTTMQDVLNQSLNTGMVFVEQKLGKQKMREYLLGYGIKEKTGIDLPNETSGLVSGILNSPREIEYANAAFGQGIALTPVGLARALASLGNGGNLVTPHVVEEIKYTDGGFKKMIYPTVPTKITPQTSDEITRMLVTVMDKGIGKPLEHFSVAAKTGTAQVADSENGGYYTDRHTHSFFGYFPAYDPEFIVFLYAINPKGVQYAATTWSDPFVDITKFLLNYYSIPPDR